jgi:hypothetical protein
MYNMRAYWALGLCPSPGILKNTKQHNVSETGSVSSSGEGTEDTYSAESVRKSYLQSLLSPYSLIGTCSIRGRAGTLYSLLYV